MAKSASTRSRVPRRRTQAERRATTQAALLDATVDCLVEDGYGGTTTTRIVERAGVSRGAQVHHFPTKAELVAEAIRHLARKRGEEFFAEVAQLAPSGPAPVRPVLDRMWRIHTSPLFAASMELWAAARTDPELRARLVEVEREVRRDIAAGIADVFGDLARDRRFREGVDAALALMRGLGLLEFVEAGEGRRRWPPARRLLLERFEAITGSSATGRNPRGTSP